MTFISFNVNSIRNYISKSNYNELFKLNPDIIAFQELKLTETSHENFPLSVNGYLPYWSVSKIKKGYSGVGILSKIKPINVHYGLKDNKYDDEGRAVTLEFENFYFISLYVPNSGEELKRLNFRMQFEDDLKDYIKELLEKKSVIICGDLNVAHNEIDLKNPSSNHHSAGFTDEERQKFEELLNIGLVDTFRELYPKCVKYSYWSYLRKARQTNAGWRIDYFLVNKELFNKVKDSQILNEIYGSDHCPILLDVDM